MSRASKVRSSSRAGYLPPDTRTHKKGVERRKVGEKVTGKRPTSHPYREARRRGADRRQATADLRTDEERLEILIARGHGHCVEAQRLRDRLAAA